MTSKRRTRFEQVPLEVIKKIIEENALGEKIKIGEEPRGAKKKRPSARFLKTMPASARGEGI